ncbi:N,N-dimethylformamidase beta subunit family domain-containing protein [Yinghuangia seranimata]|uniref:N,N-dimethylformamidase beta subunit family domain-containing protein n=1 Tax=Yinghuangia seranimata TaxID=408067 RepID=UPI00248AD767|nr:N,N-dimethylformamidase beta subunit family domain-containing protein [Yinghuangia seranimata]MDI2130782.1 hypothetical protein [Yinghuangia seranimata]
MSRRGALGALGAVGAAAVGLLWWRGTPEREAAAVREVAPTAQASVSAPALLPPSERARAVPPSDPRRIATENARRGSTAWKVGRGGIRAANDSAHQIKGYASATSVPVGGALDFHVAVHPGGPYTVGVYRLGHYDGAGARHLLTSPRLTGKPGARAVLEESSGMLSCDWPVGWTLNVPNDWTSGAYLAVFDDERGNRSYTVFVVRDDHRSSDFLVVLPFSTYQAYNQYPLDGRAGKSLYYGYGPGGTNTYQARARKVSFDRPYMDDGIPSRFDLDQNAIVWMERSGYDVTYASTIDVETGRVDPSWYRALVFCGHDEYWSEPIRKVVEEAQKARVGQAWLTANNMYWNVRFEANARGTGHRVMNCWREDADPGAPSLSAATDQWRRIRRPEQEFLGVQYNGIVAAPTPLVVSSAEHWLWQGTGVRDGDTIAGVVGGEADGVESGVAVPSDVRQTLLSRSPYTLRSGAHQVQSTSLYERSDGTLLFCAGTFNWALALNHPRFQDERIQRATKNLFDRLRKAA